MIKLLATVNNGADKAEQQIRASERRAAMLERRNSAQEAQTGSQRGAAQLRDQMTRAADEAKVSPSRRRLHPGTCGDLRQRIRHLHCVARAPSWLWRPSTIARSLVVCGVQGCTCLASGPAEAAQAQLSGLRLVQWRRPYVRDR